MTGFKHTSSRLAFTVALIGSLGLTACATKPDRRGPPSDRQGQGQGQGHGAARTTGTFIKPVGLLFAGMDLDRDAVVTKSELNKGIETEWAGFDRKPSAAYFAAWSVSKLGSTDAFPTFLMFDKDMNGVITTEEFSHRLEAEFNQLDLNKDDQVERTEMLIAFAAPVGQSKPQGREEGKQRGRGGRSRR